MAKDLGLDAESGTQARVRVACVLDAWESAVKRVHTWATAEAERRTAGEAKEISKASFLSLRKAHKKQFGELSDERFPAKPYIEWRLDQFEDGELVCEKLTEVIPIDAVDTGPDDVPAGHTYFKKDGTLAAKGKAPKLHPPAHAEELRKRFVTLKAC